MYYCYAKAKGFSGNEEEYAKELGVYIFYDKEQDKFFDKDGFEVNIENKNILIRTGILQYPKVMDAVIRHKGNSLTKACDYSKVLSWPNYINTKRNNRIYSGKDILNNLSEIINLFGADKIFFKTKEKNYSQIILVEDLKDKSSPLFKAIYEHREDDFILSDAVDVFTDKFGIVEYRCFVINNKILNISRAHDYLLCKVSEEVLAKALELVEKLKNTDFPNSYVLDLFIYKDNGENVIDVLECNPIECSGTYLYNSVFYGEYDLMHLCPSASIPKEKIKYGDIKNYGYDIQTRSRASIIYDLPLGFAADLLSISLIGEKSKEDSFIHLSTSSSLDLSFLRQHLLSSLDLAPIESDVEFQKQKKLG